jgi:hypothetical protein
MVRATLSSVLRLVPAAALTWVAACSNGGGGAGSLSLSLSARSAPAPAATAPAGSGSASVVASGDSTVIALGSDTLILRSLAVVLKQIELKRLETSSCDSIPTNGDCEEFESGPVLATFPLGATNSAAAVTVNAPAGQYDKLEFEIHKTDTTSSSEAAFIAANPDFKDISIRATGTFSHAGSRSDFVFTSDLDASEELGFTPALTVVDGSPANLTIRLDVSTWFVNSGALIDPTSANVGGPNEGIVQNNIKNSIDAFEDDNRDGRDDHHEGS